MKTISLALACIALASCGKKDNTSGPGTNVPLQQETKVENKDQDSDFDGINDQIEIENGMNPYIADIPVIKIDASAQIELKTNFFSRGENDYQTNQLIFNKRGRSAIEYLRAEIANIAYSKQYNLERKIKLNTLSKLNSNELRCLTQAETKRSLPKLLEQYRNLEFRDHSSNIHFVTKFKKKKKLKEINHIRLDLNFNKFKLSELKTNRETYNFRTQNFDFGETQTEAIIKEEPIDINRFNEFRNCLYYSIKDFNYNFVGKSLNYKEIFENIEKGLSHIVIIQKGELKRYSVNPKEYSIDKLLKEIQGNPIYGHDGHLVSLFNKRNNFQKIEDLNLNKKKSLEVRRWFFEATNGARIVEPLVPGQVYFLANLSVHDLLKTEISKEVILNNHKSKLKIKNIYVGDKITLETSITGELMVPPEKSYKIPGYYDVGSWKDGPIDNACLVHEFNSYINDTFNIESAERYKLKLNERDIIPEIAGDKLIYEFQVGFDEVKNFTIELQFPEQSKDRFPFKRMTNKRDVSKDLDCVKQRGVSTNSTTFKNQSAFKKLKYKTSITRRGIHRN